MLDLCTQSFRYYSDMPASHYRLLKISSNSSVVHRINFYLLTSNLFLFLESLIIHMIYVTHIYVFPSLFCSMIIIYVYIRMSVYICVYMYCMCMYRCWPNAGPM